MNITCLVGRLTRDAEVRYTQGQNPLAVGRYTLAVDRRIKRDGEQSADFISCVVFGKGAEFAEKYLFKGTKIAVTGRIQTGSYKKSDGTTVFTTDVVVESQEFVESKAQGNTESNAYSNQNKKSNPMTDPDGFMSIPYGIDEELPFN